MNLENHFRRELGLTMTRRHFFNRTATGIGAAALSSLLGEDLLAASKKAAPAMANPLATHGAMKALSFAPKAKRVIYIFMSGAPSHLDLYDYKPKLVELTGTELPATVRGTQRITGMTSGQKQLLCVGTPFKFAKHGQCGTELSEILPHTAKIVDDITIIRTMNTEAINHDPAITFLSLIHI